VSAEPITALPLGASVLVDGAVELRVWAPKAEALAAEVGTGRELCDLSPEGRGYWSTRVSARAGDDYMFVVDGARRVPDPASRHQPTGVHGPSRIVDPSKFSWSDEGFGGIPLRDAVLYELHVGTFTADGTFDAAIARLGDLARVGVTTVELMPVAAFPGDRNWGYDGVGLFAPHEAYGGPDAMRRFVDAAHAHGLGVCLDVVYNHFGPEGCYWDVLAPYTTDRHVTPWGRAMNFDGPGSDGVRAFVLQNVRAWLSEMHVDALRIDAVQTMHDATARHILGEIGDVARAAGLAAGKHVWVVAESNQNDPRVTRAVRAGGLGMDGQWSDDFHHAVHAAHLGARGGTFFDFGRHAQIAKALRGGFVLDGVYSEYRQRRHGAPAAEVSPSQLVTFIENHDQIANGRGGARLSSLVSPDLDRALLALLLLGPNVPLLFMGQERGESAPFYYFTSHGDAELTRAVREGRAREHAAYGVSMPDPDALDTFSACKPTSADADAEGRRRELVRALSALRRELGGASLEGVEVAEGRAWLSVCRGEHVVAINFGDDDALVPVVGSARHRVLSTAEARFGGAGDDPGDGEESDAVRVGPRRTVVWARVAR
jgi:maltooligosyltrehalose trehalohydrolase